MTQSSSEPVKKMTKQEMFDKAYLGLKAQGVGVLEAVLTDARDGILSLLHGRGCEAEGSDEDWVGDIDAALAKGETL